MKMNGKYEIGDVVLGNWTLNRLIGEGSYGRVYEAMREDFGVTYKAAIKIITIPQNKSEIKSVMAEGMDEKSITDYFRTIVEEIVREFSLMSQLKGTANVVGYEDHAVIPHTEDVGWDIIIRMELLTPLLDHLNGVAITRSEVIKLGVDICRALELCKRLNIVHRDIKPENIFVSDFGDYKLGDFGIARTIDKTTSGLSKKGTYTYMAPEVYKENAYGSSVDIYSLGLVLYRLLNDNRAPFLPQYPEAITFNAREEALAKRMTGEPLPAPQHADTQITEIICKACAYDPRDRYSSAAEMREALEAAVKSGGVMLIAESKNTGGNKDNGKDNEAIEEKTESIFQSRKQAADINVDDATECIMSLKHTSNQAQCATEQFAAANSARYLMILLVTLILQPMLCLFVRSRLTVLTNTLAYFVVCVGAEVFLLFILYLVAKLYWQKKIKTSATKGAKGTQLKLICVLAFVGLLTALLTLKEISRYIPHLLGMGTQAVFPTVLLSGYLLLSTIPCMVKQRKRLKRGSEERDILQEHRICTQTALSLLLYTGIKTGALFIGISRYSNFTWMLTNISIQASYSGAVKLSVVTGVLGLCPLFFGIVVMVLCFSNLRHMKVK